MDKFETRRLALKKLAHSLGRGGITKIAKGIQKEPSYVSRMLYEPGKAGAKRIGEDSVELLNHAFPDWLTDESLTLEVTPSTTTGVADGYVRLECLPIHGSQDVTQSSLHTVKFLDVNINFLRQKIGSHSPNNIKILTWLGTSMQPTIQDQDITFIDITQKNITSPGYYLIDIKGIFLIKKVMILSTGTLILKSENTVEFPDEERYDLSTSTQTIPVYGRVLAWWTLRKG